MPEKFPFFTKYILTQRKLFVNSFFIFSVHIYRFFAGVPPVSPRDYGSLVIDMRVETARPVAG